MLVKVRKYTEVGYQEDGANMIVTFVEALVIPDDPEQPGRLVLGRLFFADDLLERFGPDIVLELEEDYVRNSE